MVSLVAGRDHKALAKLALELRPEFVALRDENGYAELKQALFGTNIQVGAGREAVIEAARRDADLVVSAIVGAAGVEPTHAALEKGRAIALANKECLVCAGAPFMRAAKAIGAVLLPVDSEHNAIFQALGGAAPDTIERMTITASGGPFRQWSKEAIETATLEQALKHPNWSMGPKNTLEFGDADEQGPRTDRGPSLVRRGRRKARRRCASAVDHPRPRLFRGRLSHGRDGRAGHACADRALPELSGADAGADPRLDLAALGALTFERPDYDRFPALKLAQDVLAAGGSLPTALNAANEIAVEAFLLRRIGFADIARHVAAAIEAVLQEGADQEPSSVADALAIDHIVRERSRTVLAA